MMKRKRTRMTLWLPNSCMLRLKKEADRLGVERTKVVKIALEKYFQEEENTDVQCDQ